MSNCPPPFKTLTSSQGTPYHVFDIKDILSLLSPRDPHTYKNQQGHVLIIGGNHGYAGAVKLAALGALRTGAGLVTVATRKDHINGIIAENPEIMATGVESPQDLIPLMERATVIILGPGLGQDPWATELFHQVLSTPKPLLIDADGLNILSTLSLPQRASWILTPHPGEAARLLGVPTPSLEGNRFQTVQVLYDRYGGCVLLKGAGTLILGPSHHITLCPYGNPGMASGGMGDLLSGIIGGLVAQGLPPEEATILGVYLHAYAADLAKGDGERGMIATDLLPFIRKLVNETLS